MGYAGWKFADLVSSLETIIDLSPRSIVPARGPTIKGYDRISEVLNQHLTFYEECLDNDGNAPRSWPRPARTAYFLTSEPPWPLLEKEKLGDKSDFCPSQATTFFSHPCCM